MDYVHYILPPVIAILFFLALREMPPIVRATVLPSDHPVEKSLVWITDNYSTSIHELNSFLSEKAGYTVFVLQKQIARRESDGVTFIPLYETTQVEFIVRHAALFATTASAAQTIKTAKQMGKPCILWAEDATAATKLLPLYDRIAVITPSEWLRLRIGVPRSLTLPPLIKWSEFPVTPYVKKTAVAVFLCPETEKVWNLPYMAEQLPHISFIGYRPAMSGQVVMRPNLRYEKLAYHRHKIWEQTRLLLIPVATTESALHATEALTAGIPVLIDQKEGTLREIVGEGGVAIPVGVIANWIAVTDRLMTDNAAFEIQSRGVGRMARGRATVQQILPFLEQLSA